MRKALLATMFMIFSCTAFSQNLFDNGGFENINICTEYRAPCAPESWFNMKPNNIPTVNRRLAPRPLLGDMAFLLPIYDLSRKTKPLVYTMLLCPMQKGKQYKLSFYVYTAERKFYNIDFAFLDKEPITVGFDPYAVIPDLKIYETDFVANVKGWNAVEYVFTAKTDSKFVMLGNINSFNDMNYKQADGMNKPGMVYYFLDEMVLRPIVPEQPCKELEANLEKMYQQDLRHTEYGVAENETAIDAPKIIVDTLVLPSILFKTGSAIIDPKFSSILDTVIINLTKKDIQSLQIIGHTDNKGTYESNIILSQNRAKAVLEYLSAKLPVNNINSEGKADTLPVADNGTVAGRAKNRRVEIIVNHTLKE